MLSVKSDGSSFPNYYIDEDGTPVAGPYRTETRALEVLRNMQEPLIKAMAAVAKEPPPPVQLIAKNGSLYYPGDPRRDPWAVEPGAPVPVLCVYEAGDCDCIAWPNPNREHLRRTLFDDRESGLIEDQEVLLPDGTSAWL